MIHQKQWSPPAVVEARFRSISAARSIVVLEDCLDAVQEEGKLTA